MANRIRDNWCGPTVKSIEDCYIQCFINWNRNVELNNDFENAYRKYLLDIGVQNTKDFTIMCRVIPDLITNFFYDVKNKKVIQLYALKKNLTINTIEELMDKYNNYNKNWYDFLEVFDYIDFIKNKEIFDIDIELCRELAEYTHIDYMKYRTMLTDYVLDISKYNSNDLLKPDFPFDYPHIGVGVKYKHLDKNAERYRMLVEDGTLVNVDDNGEEAIYVHIDLEKLS